MRNIKWYVRAGVLALAAASSASFAQAWRNCIPNSMGPGGCDSMGPGGGKSMGPDGGQSMGPGGGLSMGPGGGQSMGPGGGQSIGPGGGKSITRDRSRGLDPDTLRPYEDGNYIRPYPDHDDNADRRSYGDEGTEESESD